MTKARRRDATGRRRRVAQAPPGDGSVEPSCGQVGLFSRAASGAQGVWVDARLGMDATRGQVCARNRGLIGRGCEKKVLQSLNQRTTVAEAAS